MVFSTPSTRCVNGALLVLASSLMLLLGSTVDAHGYVSSPLAEFKGGAMPTKYVTTIAPVFEGKFNDNPQANVDTFTAAFKAQSKFKTLKDLLDGHGDDCGESKQDASRKPIPADGKVAWQNPDTGEGFVPSHMGPCEVWLNEKLVFSDENCAGHFTSKPKAELPVDFSSCTDDCMLHFYWLALHEPAWQVYKNCVPLIGSGGTKSSGGGTAKKSLSFASTNAYNSPAETPAASPSPSPSPTSESGNEYGSPSPSTTPSASPSPSPSPSPETGNEYDSPSASPSPSPSPSSSPSSESSPAADGYGSPSSTPAVSPSPSPAPSSGAAYSEPQSTPSATQQGHKKCKTHARKLRQ